MNLLELATGAKGTEYKITFVVVAILGCQVLGIDAAVLLPLILDGADIVKYEELIKVLSGGKVASSSAAVWALAAVGIGYPIQRAYVKRLKASVIKATGAITTKQQEPRV